MTREMSLLVEQADWSVEDLCTVTVNALKSAFAPVGAGGRRHRALFSPRTGRTAPRRTCPG
ncbi:hypothetical protein ACWEN4_37600, partial [Streptomyces violaceorubidus]